MRTGFKRTIVMLTTLILAAPALGRLPPASNPAPGATPVAPSGAPACSGFFGLGNYVGRAIQGLREAGTMTCNPGTYSGGNAPHLAPCNTCKQSVDKWKQKIPKAADAATQADCAASAAGATASAGTTGGVNAQLSSFGNNGRNVTTGATAQNTRAANADKAKTEFQQCKQDLEKTCMGKQLADQDKQVAQAVHKACEDAAKGAGQFADQKKQDGMGLGDLSKLMGLAQQAMGMAQQANQQQQPSDMSGLGAPSATSPTPGSGGSSSTPEIATTKLDGKDSTQAPTVGFGNVPGNSQVAAVQNGITGVGSATGASSGPDAFGGGSAGLGAGASGGEVGASGGGAGGGGLGGGGNSSGASRPTDGVAGGAGGGSGENGGFEMNPGGGKAFVGLKASKAELDSVADGSLLGDNAPLDDLGARDPASEGSPIDAASEADLLGADSIFSRIKAKYSTLKGSGRI